MRCPRSHPEGQMGVCSPDSGSAAAPERERVVFSEEGGGSWKGKHVRYV